MSKASQLVAALLDPLDEDRFYDKDAKPKTGLVARIKRAWFNGGHLRRRPVPTTAEPPKRTPAR